MRAPAKDVSNNAPNSGSAKMIQAKRRVGQPSDLYEQEADRVSEEVMRMPEPQLKRACACGGGCPKCQPGDAAEHEASATASTLARGSAASPPSVRSAPVPMYQGIEESRRTEATTGQEAREKRSELAGRLLEVQLKADALQPVMTGDASLVD